MAEPRIEIIANALEVAARQQGVVRVADLDFAQMATAVAALTGSPPSAPPVTPLDPEGDGLTTRELNATNDR